MSKNFEKKTKYLKDLRKILKESSSVFVANYQGVDSNQINSLRILCKKEKIFLQVRKNTLLKISVRNTQYSALEKSFVGPTIIAFSKNFVPTLVIKIFKEFMKDNPSFSIHSGMVGKDMVVKEEIMNKLALVHFHEEAILNFLLVIKEISILKFLRLLRAISKIEQSK
ncbi:50S ribosomal protein L10 [Candidatus Riesia pediculicola]|uniref:Large ribosomal subunit protein uL10 n=1 Tax=Riesia pediculicola (strain USDA) TaxID=515618 RepID=D4G8J5_RIEPU|nr:50S ribosomal protein L10 [Candidatus Riesia pediculicola]ADD79457.1 50S ribosomal protein L10 [Candidatus Riesia pediculicola USDA]ARC53874.1 hypothetical protein AOE55_01795 [Candidatus Riesia pediculicola]ARC54554.1 hypothetical protein AOE56_02080 [Candidatus Riesia pediculicola]QOJ86505.1 50S ribosomal protein L10 [Candidatus Riesia pediculicola]